MRLGSLCTGYGGLDLAVEHVLGATTVWTSDIDPGASLIMAERFPDAPNLGNLKEIDWATVPPVEIVTAGYPCQPFSHAGKRKGLDDERHIWPYIREGIRHLRPRLVVLENVSGHRTMGLDRVLGDLAEDGLDAFWTSIRASDVGAAHRRERLFIIATPADAEPVPYGQLRGAASMEGAAGGRVQEDGDEARTGAGRGGEVDHGRGPVDAGSVHARRGVAPLLLPTPLTDPASHNGHARNLSRELFPTPSAADGLGGHETRGGDRSHELLLNGVAKSLFPTPRGSDGEKGGPNQRGSSGDLMLPSAVLLPTPTSRDHKGRNQRNDDTCLPGALLPTPTRTDHKTSGGAVGSPNVTLTDATVRRPTEFGKYTAAVERWEHVLGRQAPAPTEPTGRGGAERLSPRFVEWLMGLPEGHVTNVDGLSRNAPTQGPRKRRRPPAVRRSPARLHP